MRRWIIALAILVAGALAGLPWLGNDVSIQFGINALLLTTLAQSWNIIGGFTASAPSRSNNFTDRCAARRPCLLESDLPPKATRACPSVSANTVIELQPNPKA